MDPCLFQKLTNKSHAQSGSALLRCLEPLMLPFGITWLVYRFPLEHESNFIALDHYSMKFTKVFLHILIFDITQGRLQSLPQNSECDKHLLYSIECGFLHQNQYWLWNILISPTCRRRHSWAIWQCCWVHFTARLWWPGIFTEHYIPFGMISSPVCFWHCPIDIREMFKARIRRSCIWPVSSAWMWTLTVKSVCCSI